MLSFALSIEVLLENALSTARECRAFLRDAPHWLWSELWSSDAVEWATMLDLWRVRCAASNAVLSVMVRVLVVVVGVVVHVGVIVQVVGGVGAAAAVCFWLVV